MANKKFENLIDELEGQFQAVYKKINKAKEDYVSRHEKDFEKAKSTVDQLKKQFDEAKAKSTKAAADAQKTGSKAMQNQWKKTKAAVSLLSTSLKEVRDILATQEENLDSAKPFDKKLAAREKALQAFEKAWAKKMKKEGERKAKRAAEKKAKTKKAKTKSKAKSTAKDKSKTKTKPKAKSKANTKPKSKAKN